MKRNEIALAVVSILVIILSVHLFVFPLDEMFISLIMVRSECPPGDIECLERVKSLRSNCTPSESIVTVGNTTNNITIKVTTHKKGENCIVNEEVLNDCNSGITYYNLTGYNISCDMPPELWEKYGLHGCEGSLLNYVSPSSEGDNGGGSGGGEYIYQAYCSLEADDCKAEAANYIKNCWLADILMDMEVNHLQGGTSYWTISILIDQLPVEYTQTQKLQERCGIYHELVNAVNLPPEIPPSTIGSNMTCTIPLKNFPINSVSVRWCEGELAEYIQLIYP